MVATKDRWTIPGDPATIRAGAAEYRARSVRQNRVGVMMSKIDTAEAWSGPAANTFRASFEQFPKRFEVAADAHARVADALDDYANELAGAQAVADRARTLYEQGEAATARAKAEHAKAEQEAAAEASALGVHVQLIPTPFTDPGASMRAEAVSMFNHAESGAATAGNNAARVVTQAGDDAPDRPSMWDNIGEWWSDTWHDAADFGVDVLNGMASWANAMLRHPEDMAGTVIGLILIQWGVGGEVLGLAVDATGVGAVIGVPAGVISAGMIAAGVGLAGLSMADASGHAQTDSKVEPVKKPGRKPPRKDRPKRVQDPGAPDGVVEGWEPRSVRSGKGTAYQDPEATVKDANSIRIMDPNSRYPNGYVRFYNEYGQPIKLDGKPGSNAETHIPIADDGTYPLPEGWFNE